MKPINSKTAWWYSTERPWHKRLRYGLSLVALFLIGKELLGFNPSLAIAGSLLWASFNTWILLVTGALSLVILSWLLIATHELGHLLFAWVIRLPVLSFEVVFVRFDFLNASWTLFVPKPAGAVVTQPDDGSSLWRQRVALCTLGGPFANLVMFVAGIWLLRVVTAPIVALLVYLLCLGSCAMLLLSLAPHKSPSGFLSDGANLIAFIRGDPMTN